MKITEGAR